MAKKHSRSLLSTITDRAESTFGKTWEECTTDEWVSHWLKTARTFRQELENENLMETVKRVDEIIRDRHIKPELLIGE